MRTIPEPLTKPHIDMQRVAHTAVTLTTYSLQAVQQIGHVHYSSGTTFVEYNRNIIVDGRLTH